MPRFQSKSSWPCAALLLAFSHQVACEPVGLLDDGDVGGSGEDDTGATEATEAGSELGDDSGASSSEGGGDSSSDGAEEGEGSSGEAEDSSGDGEEVDCDGFWQAATLFIRSQAELEATAGCTHVYGSLNLGACYTSDDDTGETGETGDAEGEETGEETGEDTGDDGDAPGLDDCDPDDPITDLSPLARLRVVTGALSIDRLEKVESIDVFGELTEVESMWITGNEALVTIDDFHALDGNLITLEISENPLLERVTGFEQVESIGREFKLYANRELRAFSGLQSLQSAGDVQITVVDKAETLEGFARELREVESLVIAGFAWESLSFPRLERVEGLIQISQARKLSSLEFAALEHAGELMLHNLRLVPRGDFPALETLGALHVLFLGFESLDGFSALSRVDGELNIVGNPNFDDDHARAFVEGLDAPGLVTIMDNGDGGLQSDYRVPLRFAVAAF